MIGITATIPVEILYAAGLKPVDLNNLFITSSQSHNMVTLAESHGFPHTLCSWIKGIYSIALTHGVTQVIAVTGGDCSNTIALGEVLQEKGIEVIPFEYPLSRDRKDLLTQMERLRERLSTTWEGISENKRRLDRIRAKLRRLDELTYQKNVVTGLENHLFLVASSDFQGDPEQFEKTLDEFLASVKERAPLIQDIRLGYLGVPPIFSNLYTLIESQGGRVVFNEVQRQFSMPFMKEDVVEQYLEYTYPYDVRGRITDIESAIRERKLDGLIHYTQTFCYRQIYDVILRKRLRIPILTLEGDRPGPVDSRTAIRIETFIEMLRDRKPV